MDALAAEIAKKKAQLGGAGGAKRRWVKTADLDQQRRQAPVATFGEADGDRTRRLAALEASATGADEDDYRLGGAYAIRNTFLKTNAAGTPRARPEDDDASDDSGDEDESPEKAPAAARGAEAKPPSDFKKIRRWIRRHLKSWEATLVARADAAKRAPQGRVETKTYKQRRVEMIDFCEAGEFVKANDAYILVAIGNSAWPIGVTSVGIHTHGPQTSSRNVAHAMNKKMQRKYLTSVKRLMKFAQDQRPDVAPSKKVT
ncbi:hypothetical protein JL722_8059 [Aureococcus anophagefferens]|nr:hypothetical protein JL722_8059 [Aureococcus anophagefferens]